jgi:hypothetical protein
LCLGPISLNSEDGKSLSLYQKFEQPVLHLKEFGGAMARFAKRDNTCVPNEPIETGEVVEAIFGEDGPEG